MDTIKVMCNHCKQMERISAEDLKSDPVPSGKVTPALYFYTCKSCGKTIPFLRKSFPENFFINPDP